MIKLELMLIYDTDIVTSCGGNQSTRRKSPTCRMSLDEIYHIMLYLVWAGFKLTTLVVIGTDCIGSYKSNYHMITATMAS